MSKWISVEDRLPEEFQGTDGLRLHVFVFGEEANPQFGLAYYDREINQWFNEHEDFNGITHWMPLPDPPSAPSGAQDAPKSG